MAEKKINEFDQKEELDGKEMLLVQNEDGTYNRVNSEQLVSNKDEINVNTTQVNDGTTGRFLFVNADNKVGETVGVFWDSVNGRVGIGMTTPQAKLHIKPTDMLASNIAFGVGDNLSNNTNILRVFNNGNVRLQHINGWGGSFSIGYGTTSSTLFKVGSSGYNSPTMGLKINVQGGAITGTEIALVNASETLTLQSLFLYDGVFCIGNPTVKLTAAENVLAFNNGKKATNITANAYMYSKQVGGKNYITFVDTNDREIVLNPQNSAGISTASEIIDALIAMGIFY